MKKFLICVIGFANLCNLCFADSGYIRNWLILGPFKNADLETLCYNMKKSPREGLKVKGNKWKKYESFNNIINLESENTFGYNDDCAGYAFVRLKSPENKRAVLLLGSDDGIKVWLNGTNILTNDASRGLTPDEDVLNIELVSGWNSLLLKISDILGGWAFSARLTAPDGSELTGMEYDPAPDNILRLAANKVAVSSVEGNNTAGFGPVNVLDGKMDTRWSSEHSDPQWLMLDMGSPVKVTQVRLDWENACAKEYRIEKSDDKKIWNTIYNTDSCDGGSDKIVLSPSPVCRYIRIMCVKRATAWGYSIFEFGVYGSRLDGKPAAYEDSLKSIEVEVGK